MTIPHALGEHYRAATSHDIHSWSYGALRRPRAASATFRDHVPLTLHDQAIFGPVRDFECACGQYDSDQFKGMICDRCGVKVAASTVRRLRFGHIDFAEPIGHPFWPEDEVDCFPLLPAWFIESRGGAELPGLYDRLIVAARDGPSASVESIVRAIVDHLTPAVIMAHNWRLYDATTLARGLALEPTRGSEKSPQYCSRCGYLIAGLRADACPGCGKALE